MKQTQLEAMTSEKHAAILHLEKETRRFREAKVGSHRFCVAQQLGDD